MAAGAGSVAGEEGVRYKGKITPFVVASCMMAAMGGVIFGYDIGISGGVTSMDPFLKKFFPEVYTKLKEDTKTSNYCKYDNELLTSFTSSLYIAGLVASFFASFVTKAYGRKPSIVAGGAAFLAGAALGGAAVNVYMLILGRVLLGVGVGFANQVLFIIISLEQVNIVSIAPMPSISSPQWHEKASGFFSSSGVKIKEARQTAGTFVEEVAKDAKGNVADVAERVGSMFKSRWALFRQPSAKQAMQERIISAAATTSVILRKGVSETKEKVAVGKTKVEEVAKKTAQKSKTILTDIERWQKGVASTDVFGAPIEVTVQRQQSSRAIPHILVNCADRLILSGLNSEHLFKAEGDKKVIQQLVSVYNQDLNASLPEGPNPVDVAALAKYYLSSLPEPLTTLELHSEIKGARSSIHSMRNILKKLPTVNYMTLEYITALFLRVSQKSPLNKMDARSLAMEMAPVIMWEAGRKPESYRHYWNQPTKTPSKDTDLPPTYSSWDLLADEDEEMDVPLDDGMPVDFGAIEVVQCLIEHHNAIFTDANETIWR